MGVAGDTCFVDDDLGGHAAEFEKIDLLAEAFQDGMAGVWQADEGQVVGFPVFSEGGGVIRANDDHTRAEGEKVMIILAQLRHVPAAEGSLQAAVEDQDDVFLFSEIG